MTRQSQRSEGVKRMRRVKPTVKPDQPERRYLYADMSQRGQLRYYVQLRNKLPKIRLEAEFGTPEFEAKVEAAIARRSYSMATRATSTNRRHRRASALNAFSDDDQPKRRMMDYTPRLVSPIPNAAPMPITTRTVALMMTNT
jgi:hypothetical protein